MSEFKVQIVFKFDLGLLSIYDLIYFDRNNDGKILGGHY